MKVLTLTCGGETVEIHMLNPGQLFDKFGGSRSGLVVGKTASLITRRISAMGIVDRELDIYDADIWEWLARLINGEKAPDLVAKSGA